MEIQDFTGPTSAYNVVLSGAGISAASGAPSGDALMRRTWKRLLEHGFTQPQLRILEPVTSALDREPAPMLLETMAQVLLSQIADADLVVSMYRVLDLVTYNSNHAKLAQSGATQVTLNMDLLLEAAGCQPWHLHGVWNDPSSIVTFASQYRDGLPVESRAQLLDLLKDARVLVVGYSGRDIDVMPILRESHPAQIDWMHFSGELAPSVEILHNAQAGRMTVFHGGVDTAIPGNVELPPFAPHTPLDDLFDTIPVDNRILAAAAVAADELLRTHSMVGSNEIQRRKLAARAQARQGDYRQALRTLCAATADPSTLLRAHRLLNEIAAMQPHVGHHRRAWVLNHLLARQPRTKDAAQTRLAMRAQASGKLRAARDALFERATDAQLHSRIQVSGTVNELTAAADACKITGDYRDAARLVREAMELRGYANLSQRYAARRRAIELAHVEGSSSLHVDGEKRMPLSEAIQEIFKIADSSNDRGLAFWSATTAADIAAAESNEAATDWLAVARRLQPAHSETASAYVSLVDIERERTWGDPRVAFQLASDLERQTRSRRPTVAWMNASLAAVAASALTEDADVQQLDRIKKRIARAGARSLAARAEVLDFAIRGIRVPDASIEKFIDEQWRWEARMARADPRVFLTSPWPVIL